MKILGIKHIIIRHHNMSEDEHEKAMRTLEELNGQFYIKEKDVETITNAFKIFHPNVDLDIIDAECF